MTQTEFLCDDLLVLQLRQCVQVLEWWNFRIIHRYCIRILNQIRFSLLCNLAHVSPDILFFCVVAILVAVVDVVVLFTRSNFRRNNPLFDGYSTRNQ